MDPFFPRVIPVYVEITMYETLLRPHEVSQVPAPPSIGAIAEKLKQSERRREEKRQRQIASAARARNAEKRKREEDETRESENASGDLERKRLRLKEKPDVMDVDTTSHPHGSAPDGSMKRAPTDLLDIAKSTLNQTSEATTPSSVDMQIVSKIVPDVRGHTSYLTFAILLPGTNDEGTDQKDDVSLVSTIAKDTVSISALSAK